MAGTFHLLNVLLLSLCVGVPVGASSTQAKRQTSSGSSYPTFTSVPETSFSCDQYGPGYYADPETDCQVFHVCHTDNVDSFLCPAGTVFNQKVFVCDWWYNVDCSVSVQFYSLNSLIGRETAAEERSGAVQSTRTVMTATGNLREATQKTSAVGSQSQPASFSRTRLNSPSENDLIDGRSNTLKQDNADRIDAGGDGRRAGQAPTVSPIGQDGNYGILSTSRSGSARNGEVANLVDNSAPGTLSADRNEGITRGGRVLDDTLATESRAVATPASPQLNYLPSNSRSSQKSSLSGVPSNSIRQTTFTKDKMSSKTSPSSLSNLSGSEVPSNPRKVAKPTSQVTARPTSARRFRPSLSTAFQRSTPRPFRPTIPRFTRPPSSSSHIPETATRQPPRPVSQESLGPVDNAPSATPTLKPQQPDGVPFEFSTQRPSTAQIVTFRPSSPRPSTSRPVTSRPVTSRPVTSRPITSRPVTSRPVTSRPVTSRPVTSRPVTSRPVTSRPVTSRPVTSRPVTSRPVISKPTSPQLPVLRSKGQSVASSKPVTSELPSGNRLPSQYRFDRVRSELVGRLAGVEPLNVPADRLVLETRSPAPGRLVFSTRGQPQPDWLYALGGLVL